MTAAKVSVQGVKMAPPATTAALPASTTAGPISISRARASLVLNPIAAMGVNLCNAFRGVPMTVPRKNLVPWISSLVIAAMDRCPYYYEGLYLLIQVCLNFDDPPPILLWWQ